MAAVAETKIISHEACGGEGCILCDYTGERELTLCSVCDEFFHNTVGGDCTICTRCQEIEMDRYDRLTLCEECKGTGSIPMGYGGNMELETNCPACTPDYR